MSNKQYSGSSKKTGDYGYKSESLGRNNSRKSSSAKKDSRSAKIGMIIAIIQLIVSVIFVYKLIQVGLSASVPLFVGIVAILIILFGIALFMQQKGTNSRIAGKIISILVIIVLTIGSLGMNILTSIGMPGGKKLSYNEPFVVFVSANDTFGALNEGSNGRSDTNIIAAVNPKTYTILMISTPRDYYVPIKAEGVAPASYDKLTHVGLYGNGIAVDSKGNIVGISDWTWACEVNWQPGNEALMNTLKSLYSINVDDSNYHYVKLNFTGFADLIDALGGITVDVDEAFSTRTYADYGDIDNGERKTYTFNEGEMKMDGNEALTFARERKSFANGDIQRNKNQVKVLKAMAKKMLTPSTLLNYNKVVNAIEDSFTTDMDISSLVSLQTQISGKHDYEGWNIMSYSVSGVSSREICTWGGSSLSVVLQDPDMISNATNLIQMVLDGETADVIEAQITTYQGE